MISFTVMSPESLALPMGQVDTNELPRAMFTVGISSLTVTDPRASRSTAHGVVGVMLGVGLGVSIGVSTLVVSVAGVQSRQGSLSSKVSLFPSKVATKWFKTLRPTSTLVRLVATQRTAATSKPSTTIRT